MVRSPTKTCPGLSRLLSEGPPDLIERFLGHKSFEKLDWLAKYCSDPSGTGQPSTRLQMMETEPKAKLLPLETEAIRIITLAQERGQMALDGVVMSDADPAARQAFLAGRDELARSLWAYIGAHKLFEAAENTLHLRLYRRYDKHYQTFLASPVAGGETDTARQSFVALVEQLTKDLDRGVGYRVDRYDIPLEGDDPASEMYLIRHPNLPTAAKEIDEEGSILKFYFRPPGEAMVVFTPSTGRIHVRADTRVIRHKVAAAFITKVLSQEVSHQPVDFQAYDISRFLTDQELPDVDDQEAVILKARVIRLDVSIGSLSNRLAISTTIDPGVRDLIAERSELKAAFTRAAAVRFVEIAVRYRRAGKGVEQTLDFTISDGNTSSLLSLDDPFERLFGHRLLRKWGFLVEGRKPEAAETGAILAAILPIWDQNTDKISGAWLNVQLGFLAPVGWDEESLIDEGDGDGPFSAEVGVTPNGAELKIAQGHVVPAGNPEQLRQYRVRIEWVAEYLKNHVVPVFKSRLAEKISDDLFLLGSLDVLGREVPVYLARRLDEDRGYAGIDTELRSRSDLGIGLVLNAGCRLSKCIAANVLVSLADYLAADGADLVIDAEGLRAAYRRHRGLANGGQTVELQQSGENAGTLFVPGIGSIEIRGENRLLVIGRLVDAHNSGVGPMKTEDMVAGIGDQSLSNIFNKPLWEKLKATFLRTTGKGKWEIAI
jgi:hypothetical protein